jgi:hypothetical protein
MFNSNRYASDIHIAIEPVEVQSLQIPTSYRLFTQRETENGV